MGGHGGIVEADETYFGKLEPPRRRPEALQPADQGRKVGPGGKRAIVSLVERGGSVRSFHVENADKATVNAIVGRKSLMKPGCIPTRAASTAMCASMSPCTSQSGTLAASMSR